ncbi:DUF1345 domain-containing protein [Aeromicrobium sp.]|uniref:DUF1345 domain-containing protein n=1 Tax=Aeromicrobium sp. TaxID=1871063 RepID=UPI0019CD4A37|nr:DUF1345 domain-containing protein [Aeromicrobium sp.]MBC7632485.1 DUF1345 domain-containing protein [Aeromicrobium sp.]
MSSTPITHRYALRFVVMLVAGVAATSMTAAQNSWTLALVVGWAAASFVYVAWVWCVVGRMDGAGTASHAAREDPVRGVAEFMILLASLASIGAVALLLVEARGASNTRSGVLAAGALGSVALSWLLIHTLFMLRYARQYYTDVVGGIDFNSDVHPYDPRYIDFAYVSFSLGMTYQISDTDLRTSEFRATALRHALLSYVFGTLIVATTINLAVSLSG